MRLSRFPAQFFLLIREHCVVPRLSREHKQLSFNSQPCSFQCSSPGERSSLGCQRTSWRSALMRQVLQHSCIARSIDFDPAVERNEVPTYPSSRRTHSTIITNQFTRQLSSSDIISLGGFNCVYLSLI